MNTKFLMKPVLTCCLVLAWAAAAPAGVWKYIAVNDGGFNDWVGVRPLYSASTWGVRQTNYVGFNFRDIAVANDQNYVFVRFSLLGTNGVGGNVDPSVLNRFRFYFDTDSDPLTGYTVTPNFGAEIQLRGTWSGALTESTNGNAQGAALQNSGLSWGGIGLTPPSTNYEFRIAYSTAKRASDGKFAIPNPRLAIMATTLDVNNGVDQEFPPVDGPVLYYTLANPVTNVLTTNLTLVDLGTTSWKYNKEGVDLGTAWRDWGFDNNDVLPNPAWGSGPGLLGYSTSPGSWPSIQTPLASTANTYYFRAHFNWSGFTSANAVFVVTNHLSDGAVIYLNGSELRRIRMPEGAITHGTSATGVSPGGPEVFTIPASALTQGENVLAVETHQAPDSSADMVFGLSLTAGAQFPILFPDPSQPADRTVVSGTSTTFSTPTIGSGPLTYQWLKNTQPILNATNATYVISPIDADAGAYALVVMNSVSTNTSRAAVLTVTAAPVVITDPAVPADRTVMQGLPATFEMSVTGGAPLSYYWYHDSALVSTSPTYVIPTVQTTDAGSYFAIVSNAVNAVTSRVAILQVNLDTTAPGLASVWGGANQVILTFTEPVELASASTLGNYSIGDLPILNATRNATNSAQVVLSTGVQQLGKLYTVAVTGVKDLFNNPISNATGVFRPTITIDGNFVDWETLTPLYSGPQASSVAANFKDVYAWNDDDYVYFRATTWEPTTWQSGYVQMFFDTDNDEFTGYQYWHGTEMEVDGGRGIQQKASIFNAGTINGLDWLCFPSDVSTNFEFRISRRCAYNLGGGLVFTTNSVNFVFASFDSVWAVVNTAPMYNDPITPNDGGYMIYPFFIIPGHLDIACNADSGNATVSWATPASRLQSSESLEGPWVTIDGAASPYSFTPTPGAQTYFRLEQ